MLDRTQLQHLKDHHERIEVQIATGCTVLATIVSVSIDRLTVEPVAGRGLLHVPFAAVVEREP